MMNAKILISGAGIAGPAFAYWLEKHGFTPTVVETSPQLRVGGFAIDVRGPGAEVVKKMGLRQKLEMDEFWVETMRTDLSRVL